MAEPVIVPVQLEVTDIDMSNFDSKAVQKAVSGALSGIKKSIQDVFSGIDPSAINKPIKAAITAVEKSLHALDNANADLNREMIRAGQSTSEYKGAVGALDSKIKGHADTLSYVTDAYEQAREEALKYKKQLDANPNDMAAKKGYYNWASIANSRAKEGKSIGQEIERLQAERAQINPLDYVDKADTLHLEGVARAYHKVLTAINTVNKKSEEFNQTVRDNSLTDEYIEWQKQAEKYQTKLNELNEKSKRMEALGATDKQWEALRYDVDQVSSAMNSLVVKMREAVKTGAAFRFGEGDTAGLYNQIRSFSGSARGIKKSITERAMANESPYTEDYQKALDELDKLEAKVAALKEKSAKMIELGASKKQFESLAYDAESLSRKVDEARAQLSLMVNEGKAFRFGKGDSGAEIDKVAQKSNTLQSSLTGIANGAKQAQGGLTALAVTHPKLAMVLTVTRNIGIGLSKVVSTAYSAGRAIVKGLGSALSVLYKLVSAVGRVASAFANVASRIFNCIKSIRLFGRESKKAGKSSHSMWKSIGNRIVRIGLTRLVFSLVQAMVTTIKDGFGLISENFDEVGKPVMKFTESLNRLRGAFASAFQPIITAVIPILTKFMDVLSGAFEAFSKFTAVLFGQKYVYKAVAKEVNSVANAAKKANKELGAYDKLEVIKKDDLGYDYEQQDITSAKDAASNFARMVKEAWEKADFTGVGVYVTEQLLEVLDKVEKNFAPKMANFANRVMSSMNTFINGFDVTAIGDKIGSIINVLVDEVDWSYVGTLYANLYNVVWRFFDGLANGIDWNTLGTSVATGIDSLVTALDLESWVGMISGLYNGISSALLQVIANVDWVAIAEKFGNTVNSLFTSIDIGQIGTAINMVFGTIWSLIRDFFATVDFGEVASSIAQGINNIFVGGDGAFGGAATNVAKGLVDFFVTAITEIDWGTIANTLLDGVETVLSSLGGAMSSSDNPIIASFGTLVTAFGEIVTILRPAIESIVKALSPIINAILPIISKLLPPIAELIAKLADMVVPVILKIIEALMPYVAQIIDIFLPRLFDLLDALQPIFDAIVENVLPVITHLLDVLLPLIDSIHNAVTDISLPLTEIIGPVLKIIFTAIDAIITILEPILSVIGTLCDVLGDILGPILEIIAPLLDSIAEIFEIVGPLVEGLAIPANDLADVFKFVAGVITGTLKPALEVIKTIITVVTNVVKMLAQVFKSAFTAIKDAAIALGTALKKPLNGILSGIEAVANGIIKGINSMIKALNKLSFDVPNWVPGIGGEKFGFNLKEIKTISIPRLAQGAVIPPNREFLAMLGDQKHGTNIEAPLDTIKQALAEVLTEVGGGTREPIVLEVNGRTLAKVVWDEQEKRYKQTGKYAMA